VATQRAVTSQRVVNVGTVADMRSSSVSGGPGCGRGLVAHRAVDLATGRGWKLELPMWAMWRLRFTVCRMCGMAVSVTLASRRGIGIEVSVFTVESVITRLAWLFV
jgi:hypothetical protein